MMPVFDDLLERLDGVHIAHHIRGRIRLKLGTGPAAVEFPRDRIRRFQAVLDRIPGVHGVRVNLLARSCIVDYNPAVIPFEAWDEFLSGIGSPAAGVLERILRDTYRELMNAEP